MYVRSVFLGGGDAERARVRLVGRSEPAVCNWRRDFRKEVFRRVRSYVTLPFFVLEKGVRKPFFRKPPRHCATLVNSVSGGEGMRNPSRFGAYTALAAATIVHDVRDVT